MMPYCPTPNTLTESPQPNQEATPETPGISRVREVSLSGEIDAATDLSGVAVIGDFLVLGADEGHQLQVLTRDESKPSWRLLRTKALAKQDQETDIEAVAYGDGHLYVVGSHSARRRLMRDDLSSRRNRERLLEVRVDEARNRLYRLPFDAATGKVGKPRALDLSKRLRKDPLLHVFYGIPGKENGIDIEGLAYRDGRLALGFRGPVLRDNYVPVMVFEYDNPKQYELSFVRLRGQGIRDLVALPNGYLILSGPTNDAPGPYRLWWWDGADQVPGKDLNTTETVELGEVSTPGGAKAEGLALLECGGSSAEVIVIYETTTSAQAVSMTVKLPS
jgi:hypothetical protein